MYLLFLRDFSLGDVAVGEVGGTHGVTNLKSCVWSIMFVCSDLRLLCFLFFSYILMLCWAWLAGLGLLGLACWAWLTRYLPVILSEWVLHSTVRSRALLPSLISRALLPKSITSLETGTAYRLSGNEWDIDKSVTKYYPN